MEWTFTQSFTTFSLEAFSSSTFVSLLCPWIPHRLWKGGLAGDHTTIFYFHQHTGEPILQASCICQFCPSRQARHHQYRSYTDHHHNFRFLVFFHHLLLHHLLVSLVPPWARAGGSWGDKRDLRDLRDISWSFARACQFPNLGMDPPWRFGNYNILLPTYLQCNVVKEYAPPRPTCSLPSSAPSSSRTSSRSRSSSSWPWGCCSGIYLYEKKSLTLMNSGPIWLLQCRVVRIFTCTLVGWETPAELSPANESLSIYC